MDNFHFGKALSCPANINKDIKVLINPEQTEFEKMKIVYDYIRNYMQWNNLNSFLVDDNLRSAYNKKIGNAGDINLMLVAILKEIGLTAEPVIISTRKHGFVNQAIPTISDFNYVIALVKIDNKNYLLDATEKNCPLDLLPIRCINGNGRLVKKDYSQEIILLTNQKKSSTYLLNLSIDINGNISGTMECKLKQHAALDFRNDFSASTDTSEFISDYENNYNGLDISNYSFKNLDDIYKPVSYQFDVTISDNVEIMNNMMIFKPLLFFTLENNPFKLEKREYPVDFTTPFEKMIIVSYSIPEGYIVESIPEKNTFNLPENAGKFTYSIVQFGNVINITSKFEINKTIFSQPEYASLKMFYSLVVKKQNEQIIIKKSE